MAVVQSQVVLETNIQSLHFDATRFYRTPSSYRIGGVSSSKTHGVTVPSLVDTRECKSEIKSLTGNSINFDAGEMRVVFQRIDENGDGLICCQDLQKFMSRLGCEMSEVEAEVMLDSVDSNGDGWVDIEEFFSLYRSLCDEDSTSSDMEMHIENEDEDETLLEAFRVFDKNEDGFITAQELQIVLLDLGMPEGKSLKSCERMIQRVDSDGNGEIDIREFKEMMNSNYIYCEV